MKYFFVTLICFLFVSQTIGQDKVENPAFNVVIKKSLSHTIDELSVDEVKKMNNVIFLDARELVEFNVSHLKNAIWVGYDDFKIERLSGVSKEKEIVIYCSIGYRSEKIGEKLIAAGYENVYNLYGGIFEWVNTGNEIYNKAGELTQQVHAHSRPWGVWLNKGEKVY